MSNSSGLASNAAQGAIAALPLADGMPGEVGVERAAFVLKNVRAELLEGK